jgi:citrate synthase
MVSQWEVKQAIVKIKNKPQKKLCINLNVIDTFILTELGIPINYRHVLFSDSKNLLLMR